MKRKVKVIILFLIFSVIVYLGYNISQKIIKKKHVAERIQSIPDFSFNTLEGNSFIRKDLNPALPKLFVYFNSECDFCHAEANQIQEHLEELKNIQIIMISHESVDGINAFAKKYELHNLDNVIFLEDEKLLFSELFDAKSIPFMLLYAKDNTLIQKFKGATKIENVIKLIE